MTIGENIKKFRKSANLTQKQLAEKCGLAPGTIQQYELGKREPRIEQQQLICDALNIPMIALISGTLDPINNATFFSGMNDVLTILKTPNTLAAHFDGEEFTEEELDEIRKFAEFVKSKRQE